MPGHDSANALVDRFVEAVPSEACIRDATTLDAVLTEMLASARARWPSVRVDDKAFVAYVAVRAAPRMWVEDALTEMATDDLYLACACVLGDSAAFRELDRNYLPRVANRLSQSGFDTEVVSDVIQDLRIRLLMRRADEQPRLTKYGGKGKLVAWLSVLARRDALAQRDRRPADRELEEELTSKLPSGIEFDSELATIRCESQELFARGFAAAMAALPARDRRMLRDSALRGISHGELAARFGVDRTTILRRIRRAQSALRANLRRFMLEQGELSLPEYESLLRVLSETPTELAIDNALGRTAEHPASVPEADPTDPLDDSEK